MYCAAHDYCYNYNNYNNNDDDDDDDDDDNNNDDDDDDDDDSYPSSFSEEDFVFYNNPANVFIDMHGNTFTLNDNDKVIFYDDDAAADDDKPMTTQATQQQIDAILDHDIFLFHRLSGKTPYLVNKKATTTACTTLENAQTKTPAVKDDPSITPTLGTLSTPST